LLNHIKVDNWNWGSGKKLFEKKFFFPAPLSQKTFAGIAFCWFNKSNSNLFVAIMYNVATQQLTRRSQHNPSYRCTTAHAA